MPGKDNVVADALSRFAYPACKAFQDASFHGSKQAKEEMREIIKEELAEGRCVGLICPAPQVGSSAKSKTFYIAGEFSGQRPNIEDQILVVTRSESRKNTAANTAAQSSTPQPRQGEDPAVAPNQKSERWTVIASGIREIIDRLGCGEPVLDCFADKGNHRFPRWWGKGGEQEDAFAQDWGSDWPPLVQSSLLSTARWSLPN